MSSTPNIEIDIEGFPELLKKIKEIADDKKKKTAILGLLRQVAGSTVRVAKRLAPVSKRKHLQTGKRTRKWIMPGNLQRSIGTITGKKGKSVDNPTIVVGPRTKGANDGWYGNFVENGFNIYNNPTKYVVTRGSNRVRFRSARERIRGKGVNKTVGSVDGKFFMKRAYEQTQGKVTSESEVKVARYIQRAIDKLSVV